jgi:hypothetical protein
LPIAAPKGLISRAAFLKVSKGGKIAADAAQLFKIYPATVSRLLTKLPQPSARKADHAK